MHTTALLRPAVIGLLLLAAAGCNRGEPGVAVDPAASADAPEAGARARTGELIQGAATGPAGRAGAMDARPLAGQAEIGVRSLLGNPTACEDVDNGRRCRYAHAATDITYIDGMADWITVDDLGDAPFSAAALARVGLPTDEDPIESTPELIRWQNLGGYREVTLHAGPDGRADRLELKMATL